MFLDKTLNEITSRFEWLDNVVTGGSLTRRLKRSLRRLLVEVYLDK